MAKSIHRVTTVLRHVEDLGGGVRVLTLADPDDWELPPFAAGAHVDLHLPSGRIRQYSLCGDPTEPARWRVAVGLEAAGRGGSAEAHGLEAGTTLLASLPRNLFPLAQTGRAVMVAGGIGITPFLSMAPVLARAGRDFELHVCTPGETPFGAALAAYGDRVRFHRSADGGRLDLTALIAGVGPEDHLYCCGPARMVDEAAHAGAVLGERLHIERFGVDGPAVAAAYEIELARSGRVIPVGVGQTMLDALRGAGLDLPATCEGGVCLDCRTRYLAGEPEHRDLALTAAERGAWLTPCVSGCAGGRIVLDL